jgi:arylsulfatase A-like enzyme
MSRPNFIIFMTDDQGYGDLSCMGNTDFRTPNLDRLAASGVRFTDWYTNSPVCSPSRAALLTGRYPINAGVRSILSGARHASGLSNEVPTLSSVLKQNGYQTAIVGKWHLGVTDESRPSAHGFDEWFGFLAGCIDYYSHIFYWEANMPIGATNPVHDLWHNGKELWENGQYFTELITENAVKTVRRMAQKDEPFFLYVPYNAPHYPMHAPKKYVDRFPDLSPDRRIMAAMISAMDDSVGAVMDEIVRQDLLDNTVIFFMSDNGPSRESRNWLDGTPDPYYGGSSGGLKGHKFSLYEGGIRVPGIMSWPARIPSGQVIDAPAAAMDVFPTFLKAAGIELPESPINGIDLMPLLADGIPLPERTLFWEMGNQTALRRGQWKLVLNGQLVEGAPPEDAVHLANLADDLTEAHNLADQEPELRAELENLAHEWRSTMDQHWDAHWAPRIKGPMVYAD